jgi:ABC-type phosphate transport system permease subunit
MLVSCSAYLILETEVICFSETNVVFQWTAFYVVVVVVVICQKIVVLFITTAMETSNSTKMCNFIARDSWKY